MRHLTAIFLTLLLALSAGCSSKSSVLKASHTTLRSIQVSGDILWAEALQAKFEAERAYVEGVQEAPREARPSRAEVEAKLEEIRERWEPRFAAFRSVRHAHSIAVDAYNAYEAGDVGVEELLQALEHVVGLYESLKDLLDNVEDEGA